MSCQGSSIKRLLKKVFSFTRRGALFFLLSAMILVIGALRMELSAILWGSAFTLLGLYSLLANRIMQALLRHFFERAPDPVDFTLSASGVFPRSPATAELTAEIPRHRAPGFKIRFEILLHWQGREPLRLSTDLRGGRNRHMFEFTPAYRGCYQSREVRIVVSDLLGFTRFPIELSLAEQLRVYPAVQPEAAKKPRSFEGGREENRGRRQRRSQELLEVRKYFPGDDIRKVHWKVYAHTSQLFLRIGEETPPPESRFLVILDSAPTTAVAQRIQADYLDVLVEVCAATILDVLARGYQVFFATCDSLQPRQLALEKKMQLLAELAGVRWNDRYALELPRRLPQRIILFSSPGSTNLARMFSDLQKRAAEVRLFFPDLPVPVEQPQRSWMRKLVLRPAGEQGATVVQLAREEIQNYQTALDRDAAQWNRNGRWKVVR